MPPPAALKLRTHCRPTLKPCVTECGRFFKSRSATFKPHRRQRQGVSTAWTSSRAGTTGLRFRRAPGMHFLPVRSRIKAAPVPFPRDQTGERRRSARYGDGRRLDSTPSWPQALQGTLRDRLPDNLAHAGSDRDIPGYWRPGISGRGRACNAVDRLSTDRRQTRRRMVARFAIRLVALRREDATQFVFGRTVQH